MDKHTVTSKLRERAGELASAGLRHLYLHGSVVRGQERANSDVDLAADFATGLSLVDLLRIEGLLSDILGTKVDLADAARLKDRIRENFEREAELVF